MTIDNDTERAFLLELFSGTQGDPNVKKSMHEVGAAIGLDKAQSSKTAEDLIGIGLVEIKTLSGGIGITAEGVDAAHQAGAAPAVGSDRQLSAGPIIDAQDRQVLEKMLADVKPGIAALKSGYTHLEEMVMDVKTVEVHLLSPKPKTAVIREILRALQSGLEKAGAKEIAGRIKGLLG